VRTFVIGDIHGAYKALLQCFERSGFDCENDRLIALGDVCDGWTQVRECIDELLKIKHLVYILGNHDAWTLNWARTGTVHDLWFAQGGNNTILSYANNPIPQSHVDLLANAPRYLQEGDRFFVHAGFDPSKPIAQQDQELLIWDRKLIVEAFQKHNSDSSHSFGGFKEIFLGHTPTLIFHVDRPLHLCNVWALDTGAGWSGKLTIMDMETKKFWQSDLCQGLYPDVQGRTPYKKK
jgi:serine/threonine protein phosphatase 1